MRRLLCACLVIGFLTASDAEAWFFWSWKKKAPPKPAPTTPVLQKGREPGLSAARADALVLRGKGDFSYLGNKLYEVSLYLPESAQTEEEIHKTSPKKISIRYDRDIPRSAILEATEKNLKGNPKIDLTKLCSRSQEFHSKILSVKKDDVDDLVYAQGRTVFYHNGKKVIEIPGEDFAQAYFGIWLSKYPINQKLKKKLLGVYR